MARNQFPEAIIPADVIGVLGGNNPSAPTGHLPLHRGGSDNASGPSDHIPFTGEAGSSGSLRPSGPPPSQAKEVTCSNPSGPSAQLTEGLKGKLSPRTKAAMAMIFIAIPVTIFLGIWLLDDRKYYFISLLILLETMLPFVLVFESRKPQARELVVIAVLCAIAIVARSAFFMVPSFKPMAAIVIIAAVCFGGEAGFFVGALSMFVSNMLMGQGPWTPWQMFCMGLIGFLAGVLFQKGVLPRKTIPLCIYAMIAVPVIYGGLMNPASVLIYQPEPTWQMFASAYALGMPFDLIHGASAVVFLLFLAKPMIEKMDRIKLKYGLIQ
ncbi:MAG: ECF transporter S component [Clostridiales bacterium]|nr:ECF transporter S component [Clostridiales bacterium]